MLCRATQDGWVMAESSDKTWSTGEGNGKPLQYSCLENPMNSMKRLCFTPSYTHCLLQIVWAHPCQLYPQQTDLQETWLNTDKMFWITYDLSYMVALRVTRGQIYGHIIGFAKSLPTLTPWSDYSLTLCSSKYIKCGSLVCYILPVALHVNDLPMFMSYFPIRL